MSALYPHILQARSLLATGLERLKVEHKAGRSGVELCAAASDLRDEVLQGLYRVALQGLEADHAKMLRDRVALVAHGGYGRRDVAPYSDVDLMILHARRPSAASRRWPSGCCATCSTPGWCWATACARRDAGLLAGLPRRRMICTSLVESRLLAGSEALFARYHPPLSPPRPPARRRR